MMKFLKSYLLQLILSIIACLSWLESSEIGNRSNDGTYLKGTPNLDFDQKILTGTDVTSGYDGGALAMGIICSVCIIMIVWIEINKKPKP